MSNNKDVTTGGKNLREFFKENGFDMTDTASEKFDFKGVMGDGTENLQYRTGNNSIQLCIIR